MLLRGWLGAANGGDGGRDLRGDRRVLPGRRLRLVLHVLQLLQLEMLLQLLLQLLLADLLLEVLLLLLLQVLLHVVLEMLLLHLLLNLLMHLVLLQLLLLHLLHLLLLLLLLQLQLMLLGLHRRAHLGGGCRANHGCSHGAYKWSPNVRGHVGCNGD